MEAKVKRIPVRRLNVWERLGEAVTEPLAVLASGARDEYPNRTRFWNTMRINAEEIQGLNFLYGVHCPADPTACKPRWGPIPRSHIPILGGWRKYVVLESDELPELQWYVGWCSSPLGGQVSRVPIAHGKVRMLIGDRPVYFFGLDLAGFQIPIRKVGEGAIGDGGEHRLIYLH